MRCVPCMFEKRHQRYPLLGYFFVSYPYTSRGGILLCFASGLNPWCSLYFLVFIFYKKFLIISQFRLTHTWENLWASSSSDNHQNGYTWWSFTLRMSLCAWECLIEAHLRDFFLFQIHTLKDDSLDVLAI